MLSAVLPDLGARGAGKASLLVTATMHQLNPAAAWHVTFGLTKRTWEALSKATSRLAVVATTTEILVQSYL